jgi:ribosomal protein L11 methyltransferase
VLTPEYFDVLNIQDDNEKVDIIQSLIGNDCLGSYSQNGTNKLYFNGGLRDQVEMRLKALNTKLPFNWEWEKQNKKDWHLMWQDNFHPVIIDEKLAVIPHWQADSSEDIVIKIKPGMAFGTGHHETTWLMLSQMMGQVKSEMSVLDLGTGSGILSIAAKKMGACKVDSVENDPNSEPNFHENLQLNKITNGIQFHHEDVLSWNRLDYDLILANINRNVIEGLIPILQSSKGTILLSGLLVSDYEAIEKLCQQYHLQVKEKIRKGEWICLTIE